MELGDVIAIVSVFVAIGIFLLGFFLGKRDIKKQLANDLKLRNLELYRNGIYNTKYFLEDGTPKLELLHTAESVGDIVDIKNKKIITQDGPRDMIKEELEKYGGKSAV